MDVVPASNPSTTVPNSTQSSTLTHSFISYDEEGARPWHVTSYDSANSHLINFNELALVAKVVDQ